MSIQMCHVTYYNNFTTDGFLSFLTIHILRNETQKYPIPITQTGGDKR